MAIPCGRPLQNGDPLRSPATKWRSLAVARYKWRSLAVARYKWSYWESLACILAFDRVADLQDFY
jgi:hypothetical protein